MVPVYDYWGWVELQEMGDSWGYYAPGDDPDADLHYASLDSLLAELAEEGLRGTVEIIAVARRGGPWNKIEVDLEAWCRHFEPGFLA